MARGTVATTVFGGVWQKETNSSNNDGISVSINVRTGASPCGATTSTGERNRATITAAAAAAAALHQQKRRIRGTLKIERGRRWEVSLMVQANKPSWDPTSSGGGQTAAGERQTKDALWNWNFQLSETERELARAETSKKTQKTQNPP
jgi:hypothetical protein